MHRDSGIHRDCAYTQTPAATLVSFTRPEAHTHAELTCRGRLAYPQEHEIGPVGAHVGQWPRTVRCAAPTAATMFQN